MQAGITILICTYNGAARLPATLQHIALQELPASVPCEVILVDNASGDNSVELALSEWGRYATTFPLKIITEEKPGLTYAREKGFEAAAYEYILLCDDDNWLSAGFVATAYEIMSLHDSIGILGGWGQFEFEQPPPGWFAHFNLYAGGPQASQPGRMPGHVVYGAGAVLRKTAYRKLQRAGFISLLTDRLGYQLSSGGDHELCYALALAGYDVWYDDRLQFRHFITANRLTEEYCRTYIKESSRCFSVLEPYKILLKTERPSISVFRRELLKSLGYHLRKTAQLLKDMFAAAKDSDHRIARRLELMMLWQRLLSYRRFSMMTTNFQQAVEFKERLQNTGDVPARQRPKTSLSKN